MLTIQYKKVTTLVPYTNNARHHSDEQIAEIMASIKEFGFTAPILLGGENNILAGHGRLLASMRLNMEEVPTIALDQLTPTQQKAYILADNKIALNATWDDSLLHFEIESLKKLDFDLSIIGFNVSEIDELFSIKKHGGTTNPDDVPDLHEDVISEIGDIWVMGDHRVMCGDSINKNDVAQLLNNQTAELVHADPPYGMGKEKDGVVNDNIYLEELDAFQMQWWEVFRNYLSNKGSAYIWGNSPDLWRLWYVGGLAMSEELHFCNQIVWDKKNIPGMKSDLMIKYSTTTEHCLFFKIGRQFVGDINVADYWEGWDVIRCYLLEQAEACGLTGTVLRKVCDVQMYSHWFTKSQWSFISEKYYMQLQTAFPGYFEKPYIELKNKYEEIKNGYKNHVGQMQGGIRSYFNNTHDVMRDVWEFPRVIGDERFGHATPKPVAMMERIMKSTLPDRGLCLEPFGGTGSTLIGAEKTGRRCYTMEITPAYVDVIVKRWQNFTGLRAKTITGKEMPDS